MAGVASANPTRVQTCFTPASSSTSNTLTATFASVPANGDMLVMAVEYASSSCNRVASISQAGCNWARLNGTTQTDGNLAVEVWVAHNIAGAGQTATVTLSIARPYLGCVGIEYSGTAGVVDQQANLLGVGNPVSSGTTSTTTQASEVWLSFAASEESATETYSNPTNGYAIATQTNAAYGLCACDSIVNGVGNAGNQVSFHVSGDKFVGLSIALGNVGLSLASTHTSTGISLGWGSFGYPSSDTVTIVSSTSASMANPTVVASGRALNGTYDPNLALWTPTFYQVQVMNGATLVASSNVILGLNNSSGGKMKGVETIALWWQQWVSGSNGTMALLGHPGVISAGGSAPGDCLSAGIPCAPYVSFYQTQMWGPVENSSVPLSQLIIDIGGIAWWNGGGFTLSVFTPGPTNEYYETCPNSTAFRSQVLSWLNGGSGSSTTGLFIDNGWNNPADSQSLCSSPYHSHFVPGETNGEAFMHLVIDAVSQIKRGNPNAVVLLNNVTDMCPGYSDYYGVSLNDVLDGRTAESFLATSNTGSGHFANWNNQYQTAITYETQNAASHCQWTAFSYPQSRDEDYWCYCTAKLCNLPYGENTGNDGTPGHWGIWPELTNLRLGSPMTAGPGGVNLGTAYYRKYAHGFVIVNPSTSSTTVTLPATLQKARKDIYNGGATLTASQTTVTLPAQSGRVYTWIIKIGG